MRKLPGRLIIVTIAAVVAIGGIGLTLASGSGTVNTPTGVRPSIGGWPEDVDGNGVISDSGVERIPELIKAVGDNGVEGYVRLEQLDGPQPANPAEAVAMSGQTRVLPVYAEDGVKVVDYYTIQGTLPEAAAGPGR